MRYYLEKRVYIGSRDEIDPDTEVIITKSTDDLPMGKTVGYRDWTETTFARTLTLVAARQVAKKALRSHGGTCRRIDGADPDEEMQARPLEDGEVEIWAAGDAPTAPMEVTLALLGDAEASIADRTTDAEIENLVEEIDAGCMEVAGCHPHNRLEGYLLQLRDERAA